MFGLFHNSFIAYLNAMFVAPIKQTAHLFHVARCMKTLHHVCRSLHINKDSSLFPRPLWLCYVLIWHAKVGSGKTCPQGLTALFGFHVE